MKARLKKIAVYVGYFAFYLFCLGVFLVVTFPFDKVKERFVLQFNAKQRETAGHPELSIQKERS